MRLCTVAMAAAVTAVLAIPAWSQEAAAATPPLVTVSNRFTTTAPGVPTGQSFSMTIDVSGDPAAKPPALLREVLQLPAGARFDPAAIPQCDDTDQALLAAELLADQHPCPGGSFLGIDHATMDTGAPDGNPLRLILADVDEYNARGAAGDEVVFLARDPGSGKPTTVFYGTVGADSLDVKVPAVPGPPPDLLASDRGEHEDLPVAGGYRTTPPTCPAGGEWVSTSTFYFKDGPTDTAGNLVVVEHSSTPCTAAAQRSSAAPGSADRAAPAPAPIAVPNTGAAPAPGGAASLAAALAIAAVASRRRRMR